MAQKTTKSAHTRCYRHDTESCWIIRKAEVPHNPEDLEGIARALANLGLAPISFPNSEGIDKASVIAPRHACLPAFRICRQNTNDVVRQDLNHRDRYHVPDQLAIVARKRFYRSRSTT